MAKQRSKAELRRVLVKLLPRNLLEELSGVERPWHAERKYLEARTLSSWDDDTFDAVIAYVQQAK